MLLAVGVAVVAAACGASNDDNSTSSAAPAASDTSGGAASTAAAGPKLKVGLATDQGGLNDKGFNQLAFQGATKAKDELGIDLTVKESKSEADYVPNLSYFCDNNFDVIIAIGFLMAPTVGQLAPKCTHSDFAETSLCLLAASATLPMSILNSESSRTPRTGCPIISA